MFIMVFFFDFPHSSADKVYFHHKMVRQMFHFVATKVAAVAAAAAKTDIIYWFVKWLFNFVFHHPKRAQTFGQTEIFN